MRILLLGAGGNAGINFVKSLKMKDPTTIIIGVDTNRFNLAACNSDIKELLSFSDEKEKIHKLNKIIDEHGVDFVHAQPDQEVRFLCKNRDSLNCKSFKHNIDEWELLSNKLTCAQTWKDKLNLSFESYSLLDVINKPEKWKTLAINQEKVWCRAMSGAGSKGALPVRSLKEAIAWASYWDLNRGVSLDKFMVSEYLPGEEYAVQTFWCDGELIHSQARERIEYFFGNLMPSGQSSTPSVAKTRTEEDIYKAAHRSILSLVSSPHGIYCVDMKRNKKQEIIPLEINYGRFFTTSDFFSRVGVNTPYEYIRSCYEDNIEKKINSIKTEYFWLRGLDKEPTLISGKNLTEQTFKD
jgi:carbamoyl-phosphate synthase large subunit